MGKNKERKKKKNGTSVQGLLGIQGFSDYGISTVDGEILLFVVAPTNISVLSASSVEVKIWQLTVVLSALPDIGIVCLDAAECFDDNKAYLLRRAEKEGNGKIKALLQKDRVFLDGIQTELSTARQFLFVVRAKVMKPQQVFTLANQVQKVIAEQGFDVHRMRKEEIKRFIALYFDASLYGETMPDVDGEQYFDTEGMTENG